MGAKSCRSAVRRLRLGALALACCCAVQQVFVPGLPLRRGESGPAASAALERRSAVAGLLGAALLGTAGGPAPAEAMMSDKELAVWAKKHNKHALLDDDTIAEMKKVNIIDLDKSYRDFKVIPRKARNLSTLSRDDQLKEIRLRKNQALVESIGFDEAWKMKISGMSIGMPKPMDPNDPTASVVRRQRRRPVKEAPSA